MTIVKMKIKKIRLVENEDVYDITTTKNHNFVANGIVVHNCGEAVLGAYGACDLGSLVLPNFVVNGKTNWKLLASSISLLVRFLDNVLDVNKYALKEVEVKSKNTRRIGIGVMGLAEYLFAKQLRYGSDRALMEVERLMKFIRDESYKASIELAKEKGAFPKFDAHEYSKASFVTKLPAEIRMDIKRYGIRNVTLMALAPTGTISLVAEVTGGIEPLFAKAYKRQDRVSERVYIHDMYKKMIENGETIPDWFVDTFDLQPKDHFEVQALCQKYTDGAVSKTINMPRGTTVEQLSELLLEYAYDIKGATVYVDGSREGAPLQQMPYDEVFTHIAQSVSHLAEGDVQCANGTCSV